MNTTVKNSLKIRFISIDDKTVDEIYGFNQDPNVIFVTTMGPQYILAYQEYFQRENIVLLENKEETRAILESLL